MVWQNDFKNSKSDDQLSSADRRGSNVFSNEQNSQSGIAEENSY